MVPYLVTKIFLKYAVPQRPVLLHTDGHKSHLTLDCIELCQNNNIILVLLATTHYTCSSTVRCVCVQVAERPLC